MKNTRKRMRTLGNNYWNKLVDKLDIKMKLINRSSIECTKWIKVM